MRPKAQHTQKHIMTVCINISLQPMQLPHVRRWSRTRSELLGKWPKCSKFSGKIYLCVRDCKNECRVCFRFGICIFLCVCTWTWKEGVDVLSEWSMKLLFFLVWSRFSKVFWPVCVCLCFLQRGEWKCVDAEGPDAHWHAAERGLSGGRQTLQSGELKAQHKPFLHHFLHLSAPSSLLLCLCLCLQCRAASNLCVLTY